MKQSIISYEIPIDIFNKKLYIEKRSAGKWLCFKSNNIIKSIKLTKKSFQHLKRFSNGIEIIYEIDVYNKDNVFYINKQIKKEKAPFIIQVFKCLK